MLFEPASMAPSTTPRRAVYQDPPGGLEPVQDWHAAVHEHHVRSQPLERYDARLAVGHHADDLHAVVGFQD